MTATVYQFPTPDQRPPHRQYNNFGGVTLSAQDLIAMVRLIPDYMRHELLCYVERCDPPGGFLAAVLQNDLVSAVVQADQTNAARLRDYVMWLNNYAPEACFGSRRAFKGWLRKRRR